MAAPVLAQDVQAEGPAAVQLTPAQLFAFADKARDAGDYRSAEQAYRALSSNPDVELRTEARFRLGMMLADRMGRLRDAAVEFRAILDEKPKAARVRLELARMQAMMGNLGSAEREFRAAQAGGLPPEVERMVRFYANALSAAKPYGFSIEVALAPDTNINRATRSDTLGTIIGEFTLDQDAKAKSGLGLALRSQAYLRRPLPGGAALVARLSGSADLYRQSQFDDFTIGLQVGPEYRSGIDRIALSLGPAWRWYGTDPYTVSLGGNASWQHPLGKRTQMRAEGGIAHVTNRRNAAQTGDLFSLSGSLDHAFSEKVGGGLQLSASRQTAADPGYALASGNASIYAWRDMGAMTVVANLGFGHLEADERIFLYPQRRIDNRFSAGLSTTFRQLRVGPFAPIARIRWERNFSTVEIYDYKRLSGEVGITAAF
ncbi:surface lipoprotein assembly modifier [Novosphingobium sp.]|uniref:surface lipoprotein assembly modifier n=1 Tax=Novosphingobium sp. TaxID=1874826 RepID=UPI00286DCCA3|nr:surface lipoprotein assembly modifier [Novosphingobium sp.]